MSYLKKFRLDKKVVLILGGLGLIGKEISKAIIDSGAKTIILDIDKNKGKTLIKEFESKTKNIEFINFNTSDINNISNHFNKIYNNYNGIDIFINCSYPKTKDWKNSNYKGITIDLLRENIELHMNSYAWTAREIAELMTKKNNGGSIILFSSIYGALGQDLTVYENTDMKENMTYSLIKGGVNNLVRSMAGYYGKYNIRVNSICPGGVFNNQNPIFVKNYSRRVPMKRMAKVEEVASATLFLASDASSYISGTNLMVDGGWSAV